MSSTIPFPEKPLIKRADDQKRARMHAYVEWMLTPKAERDPSTKQDLAALLDVTPATLRNYDKERWVQVELAKGQKRAFKLNDSQAVIDSLFDIATHPGDHTPSASVAAGRVLLSWQDQAVEAQDFDAEDMTLEELQALVRTLKDYLEEVDVE